MLHVSLHITNNFVEVLIFTYLFKCLISFFHVAFYEFESKLCLVVAVITADGNPITTHLQYLCYESYKYYKNKELVGNKWVKQFSYLQPSKPKQPCAFKFVYIAKCKCISTSYEIIIFAGGVNAEVALKRISLHVASSARTSMESLVVETKKNFHLLRQLEISYAIIEKSSSEM